MQPLKGLTVVTLEHAIAAPFATRQLADLGARVIKIERPGTGDFARGDDSRVRGLASHFVWTNRSKESLTLDVKHPEANALLKRLVLEQADVLIQNLAPGAADRHTGRALQGRPLDRRHRRGHVRLQPDPGRAAAAQPDRPWPAHRHLDAGGADRVDQRPAVRRLRRRAAAAV